MKFHKSILISFGVAFLLGATSFATFAQSTDQELPTAVRSNEVTGRIVALDLGDPRLTRHFYAFEATPGDLIITVNSRNLNGDVDIFTAVSFRPLTKISVYANTISPEVTKSLYFRTRQILILRVEARTPNDDPGTYRITFGGTFQAFSGGIPVAEAAEEESAGASPTGRRRNKRLSSVGATIEEPAAPEVKTEEAKTPEVVAEKPPEETPIKKPAPTPRRTTPRGSSRGRPAARTPRTTPAKTGTAKTTAPPAKEKPATTEGGEEKTGERPETEKPATQEPVTTHLIIERTDGTRIDRPMSTVRRVIVEGNAIVIVMKSGRIDRIPMTLVVRMAIEP